MPKSRIKRKKGKNNRWSNDVYQRPQKAVIDDMSDNSVDVVNDGCIDKVVDVVPNLDYSALIKKQLAKDVPDVSLIGKLQDMSIQDALLKFNYEQLIIPVDGVEGYKVNKLGWLDYDLLTYYQTIEERLLKKLRDFGLGFMFPRTIESIEPKSGLEQMKVCMRIYHADGGQINLVSKPVLIQSMMIEGNVLTYDQCVSAASTTCKRFLLCKTVFNVLVDSVDCYSPIARLLKRDDMLRVDHADMDEINKSICEYGKGLFWAYIKDKYNFKQMELLRKHQYEVVLNEAHDFQITDDERNQAMKLKQRMSNKAQRDVSRLRKIN